jgi:hypothetical protein
MPVVAEARRKVRYAQIALIGIVKIHA